MRPDVSICIATCRRPEGLARLLDSLGRQKLPQGFALETIVVNNDPARPLDLEPRPGLVVLEEPRRNIALARNRALDAARGRWLAFVDDDETAEEGWLAAFLEAREAWDADGFFGPVLPRSQGPEAGWLDLETFYTRPRHQSGALLAAEGARTGNAFLRGALFETARFDARFGRSGGEDAELFARLRRAGARFRWCDAARVHEWVPSERRRLSWLMRRAFRGGCVSARLDRDGSRGLRIAGRALLGGLVYAAALPVAALSGRRGAARLVLRLCVQAGRVWGALGGGFREYAD